MQHDVAYSRHFIFWNCAENLLESRRFNVIEKINIYNEYNFKCTLFERVK